MRSTRFVLSNVTICDTFATESLGNPLSFDCNNTLPGAIANRRLDVIAIQITVLIRLRLKALLWITSKGRRYPGSDPAGSGNSAHQSSPWLITRVPVPRPGFGL